MATKRLSKYDAIFYYTDNRRVAMQASVGILVDGPINVDRYLKWVSPRVDRMPVLSMTLKPSPLGLRLPAWTPVADFNVSSLIRDHTLPSPGNEDQLRSLFSELNHERFPLGKPLWRLHIINGLEHNRSALLLCWHHCMADAEGALEMFSVMLETTAIGDTPTRRVSRAGLTRETHRRRPLHGVRAMLSPLGRRRLGILGRYARLRTPKFPFTRPACGRMNTAWRHFPREDLRAISAAFETTATDVVLAALGAAMDSYAVKQDIEVTGTNLLLQVPANVRLPDKYGDLGNELTMLPGVVPLGIDDPVERLRRVAEYNRELKELDMATVIHGMMGAAFGLATPPGQALLCKMMVSKPFLHVARITGAPPQEHALMSSVMMPPIQYSVDGQPVTAFVNLIACQFNMGFVCSPVTYGGEVTFTLSVDADNMGDADDIMDGVMAAIKELRGLAENHAVAPSGS